MGNDSELIGGMNYQFANQVKTLTQLDSGLAILPDRYRMMMKFLGPLYEAQIKVKMATQSVKELFKEKEKVDEKANENMKKMTKTATTLHLVFLPFTKTLKITKALFNGILITILPLIGIFFMIMGVVMLLVAAFDKGGGSLRAWLEDLPILGAAFGFVQEKVDFLKDKIGNFDFEAVKTGALGAAATLQEAFGPAAQTLFTGLVDTLSQQKERVIGLWENIKSQVTFSDIDIDFRVVLNQLAAGLEEAIGMFFVVYNSVYDMIFELINVLISSGILQTIITNVQLLWSEIWGAYDEITGALEGTGLTFDTIMNTITTAWSKFMGFLESSGLLDFINEIINMAGELRALWIKCVAKYISTIIKFIRWVYPYVKPYAKAVFAFMKAAIVVFITVVRTVVTMIRVVVAILQGDWGKVKTLLESITTMWQGTIGKIVGYFGEAKEQIMKFLAPIIDVIETILEGVGRFTLDGIGSIGGGMFSFAGGGIASGSKNGYPATLHGTEAVVPLPDGRTIPVTIQGMGGGQGGDNINLTINVSGGNGDNRKLARLISDEVGRTFRNRSRGSGYSRGV